MNFKNYLITLSLISTSALASASILETAKKHGNINKSGDLYNTEKKIHNKAIKKMKSYSAQQKLTPKDFKPFEVESVIVEFNGEASELEKDFEGYIGKKIDLEGLQAILAKVVKHYTDLDYLLPKIELSDKHLKYGMIKINVVPAAIDDVVILGEGENNELMQEYARKITSLKPAMTSKVQRYIALMNELPGIDTQYQLKKNKEAIELVIYSNKKKGSAYVGVDSYGLNEVGEYQTAVVTELYSPLNKNETITVFGSTTNHPNRFYDFGISLAKVVNSEGTKVHFSASHSEDKPKVFDESVNKLTKGNSFKLSLSHHLLLKANMDFEAEGGVIYRDTKNNQISGDNNQTKSGYWTADFGVKYLVKDKLHAKNLINLTYAQGLGGTFKNYASDNQIDKKFSLVRFNFFREQPLPKNLELYNHFSLNYSGDKVPESEKAVLGGRDFGRAYSYSTLDGIKFAALATELRLNKYMKEDCFVQKIQPYAFHDVGNLGEQKSDTDISKLQSAGFGLRFKLKHDINIGAEAAFPFTKNYKVEGENYKAKTNYSFFVNKVFEF